MGSGQSSVRPLVQLREPQGGISEQTAGPERAGKALESEAVQGTFLHSRIETSGTAE